MKLFVILGNQLFPLQYVKKFRKNHLFFMSEDYELCSYEKHHKLKLLFYLSCMRSYCDELKESGFLDKRSAISTITDIVEKNDDPNDETLINENDNNLDDFINQKIE